jgi:hypothetical protein
MQLKTLVTDSRQKVITAIFASLKVKAKLFLCFLNIALCHKDVGECRYSSTILVLGTEWRLVVSFTPLPLYPRR